MKKIDRMFAESAHREALKSSMKHRVGAIVVSGRTVYKKGYNKPTEFKLPNERFGLYGKGSIHAEVSVLMDLFTTDDLTLYIVRHKFKNAKPCKLCMRYIMDSSVRTVFYSDEGKLKEWKVK
jgi:deoxycytidylate deaminase